MTTAVSTEKDMAEYGKEDRTILACDYGCEVLLQDITIDKANNFYCK